MRCLYCGKELALLKRWTSGGEFCSDAHRQQYQEEYNQLALNRLLQAKPQSAPEPKLETKAPEELKPAAEKISKSASPAVTKVQPEPEVAEFAPSFKSIAAP